MLSNASVLILNSFCHPQGGASRVAIDAAIGVASRGVRVIFVGAVGPVCEELLRSQVEVICLGQRELAGSGGRPGVVVQGLWNIAAYNAVNGLLETVDPRRTIVHVHGFSQALSSSPVRCAVRRGCKVVCTLHDFFSVCPNGAFFDYKMNRPCQRRALSMDCVTANCDKRRYVDKVYRVARSIIERNIGRMPGGIRDFIGLSRRSAEIIQAYLDRDARIHYVPNPIHVAKLPPVDVAGNNSVIAVGRLETEKGIEPLLEAISQSGLPLTLVGDGPLRCLAETNKLCRVTGWISRDAVMRELESARCLVFPSLCYETYGLSVDEAAARGIPAIVSGTSAAAERIQNDVTGWHTRVGNVSDLVRCLSISRDDATIRAAGQAAYVRWWADPSTLERHVDRMLGVYEEILGR